MTYRPSAGLPCPGPRRAERPLRPARWEAVAAASQLYAQDDFRVLLDCSILSSMSTTFSALRTARLRAAAARV